MKMLKPFKSQEKCDDAISQARCIDVLRREKILHLGLFHAADPNNPGAEEYPYVVPQTYGFDFKDDKPVIYMHLGNRPENPILKAITGNPNAYFAVEADVQLVPFQSNPCLSTVRYFGVEGRGTIELLCYDTCKEDVKYAMNVMMRQMTGNFGDNPFLTWDYNENLMKSLVILKLNISCYAPTEHAYGYQAPSPWKPPTGCKSK